MNDRYRSDGRQDGKLGWSREPIRTRPSVGGERGRYERPAEPQYSSAEDETLGSEWAEAPRSAPRYGTGYLEDGGFARRGAQGQGQGYGQGYGASHGGNLGAVSTRGDGQMAWSGGSSRQSGGFAGRGPKGYVRTDARILEDVCDRLSVDDDVDASEIEVRVEGAEVTLEGTVQTRSMKHQAENLAAGVAGVSDVHNHLRVTKGVLSELKDKLTGEEKEHHYANSGIKGAHANGHS